MRSGGWQEFVSYLPASYECEESAAAISSLEKVTQVKSDTWCQHYSQQPPAGIWLLAFHNFDIDVLFSPYLGPFIIVSLRLLTYKDYYSVAYYLTLCKSIKVLI